VGFTHVGAALYQYLDGGGNDGSSIPAFGSSTGACLGARLTPGVGFGGTAVLTVAFSDAGVAPFGLFGPCAVFYPADAVRLDAFAGFRGGGNFSYGGVGGGWGTGLAFRVFDSPTSPFAVELGLRVEMGLQVETADGQDDVGFAFVPTAGVSLLAW
jgi:hypothetical protein